MIEIMYIALVFIIIGYLATGIRLFDHHTRGVVYTLGRQTRTAGPGLSIILPGIEKLKYVNVMQKSQDLGEMQLSLVDGQATIKAAIFTKISEPSKSLDVQDLETMLVQSGRSSIKTVIGEKSSDYVIKNGSKVLEEIKKNLEKETNNLGVTVISVKVYDFKVKKERKSVKNTKRAPEEKVRPKPVKESEQSVDLDDDFLLD